MRHGGKGLFGFASQGSPKGRGSARGKGPVKEKDRYTKRENKRPVKGKKTLGKG